MTSNFNLFHQDYQSCRTAFLQAAGDNLVASYQNPLRGADNECLFTDVALYGNVNSNKIIIITSALHGVEGYCGSGAQIAIIKSGILQALETQNSDIKVLVVHALNPYGMSHKRRTNEDGVDLNRNFVDDFTAIPRNPLYDDIAEALVPEKWNNKQKILAGEMIQQAKQTYGEEQFRSWLYLGQYHHWCAPFYGGNRVSWSRALFTDLLHQFAVNTECVFHIDYHTGLGDSGFGQMIGVLESGSVNEAVAMQAWGDLYVPVRNETSVAYELSGSIQSYTEKLCKGTVIAAGFEFGTVTEAVMQEAICADQWLNWYGDPNSARAKTIKQNMLDAFYVYEPWWCDKIVEQGIMATKLSIDYLKQRQS